MSDLRIEGLRVAYGSRRHPVEVLHGIDLHVGQGETLGLVGESGSGKTTVGRAVLGLAPVTGGRITFDGEEITHVSRRRRRALARHLQVVFQDPYSSLNSAFTIADILSEPLIAQGVPAKEAHSRVTTLLDRVRLPKSASQRYPREFSGGQRQRIAIARALALSPKLVICDEPVSALDLSTQGTVLELLTEIQDTTGVSYLFISHDLAVVRRMSHRVAVLYRGDVVEEGAAGTVTSDPEHPYTRRLLAANLVADPDEQAERRKARLALKAATGSEGSEAVA
ncbi:ABC transporter ATP-binding protein [Ruania alba]|uniref:ABC transporter n=1 Tax=Ruania alba TaxID=648782 RepID=A0A1H5N877_9MICO|nr:ATP-binding cassette domain-containing protein [Ruania alba]SEE97091.1 ABC transporter [Ruania alba]